MNWQELCIFFRLIGSVPPERPTWATDDTKFRVKPPVYLKDVDGIPNICFEMDVTVRKVVAG